MSIPVIRGATSPNHTQYVGVEANDGTVWIKHRLFSDPKKVLAILADHDVLLTGKKELDRFFEKVTDLTDFPPVKIAERFGWNGDAYLLRDGRVICAEGEYEGHDAELDVTPQLSSGRLADWFKQVVKPLKHNPLGLFALSIPFAAPLLRFADLGFNPAFELVGPMGTGKTTMQKVAVSTCGPWRWEQRHGLWSAHLGSKDDPAALASAYRDQALILDSRDPSALGATSREKQAAYQANAVKLSDSSLDHLCVLSSSNVPLAQWLGAEEALAVEKFHTLAIPIGSQRGMGVFDSLPKGIGTAGDFADALSIATANCYGKAYQRYLERLTEKLKSDPEEVGALVRRRLAKFRDNAGVAPDDGVAKRRADAFGIVYAGASLAREFGALPKKDSSWKMIYGTAVLTAYEMHLGSLFSVDEVRTSLLDAARHKALACEPTTTAEEIAAVSFLIKKKKKGDELWIKERAISEVVADWERTRKLPAVRELFRRDKDGHYMIKRRHEKIDLGRVLVHVLPPGWHNGAPLFDQ